MSHDSHDAGRFRQEAAQPRMGLVREFWDFLKHNKKWWLTPILAALILLGLLFAATHGTVLAPFVYSLF